MIRRPSVLRERLRDGWTLVHDERGWHLEFDSSPARLGVASRTVAFLMKAGFLTLVSKREVFQLSAAGKK